MESRIDGNAFHYKANNLVCKRLWVLVSVRTMLPYFTTKTPTPVVFAYNIDFTPDAILPNPWTSIRVLTATIGSGKTCSVPLNDAILTYCSLALSTARHTITSRSSAGCNDMSSCKIPVSSQERHANRTKVVLLTRSMFVRPLGTHAEEIKRSHCPVYNTA